MSHVIVCNFSENSETLLVRDLTLVRIWSVRDLVFHCITVSLYRVSLSEEWGRVEMNEAKQISEQWSNELGTTKHNINTLWIVVIANRKQATVCKASSPWSRRHPGIRYHVFLEHAFRITFPRSRGATNVLVFGKISLFFSAIVSRPSLHWIAIIYF